MFGLRTILLGIALAFDRYELYCKNIPRIGGGVKRYAVELLAADEEALAELNAEIDQDDASVVD